MSVIKAFSVNAGDMFYIDHNSDNFSMIDCNIEEDSKEEILKEIKKIRSKSSIFRFISTHPDEDHFHGIKSLGETIEIVNFYCVDNKATKDDETDDFKEYCSLRDDTKKSFSLYRGCTRKWMNIEDEERGSSGIEILWPILENEDFKTELSNANNGESPNNISCIIQYKLEEGVTALWMGDLETSFMEKIQYEIDLPNTDILFAPHHGRSTGKLPEKWLKDCDPSVIIIGEADSENLDYYGSRNTITQNSAKDIVIDCKNGEVDFYVGNENYSVSFLENKGRVDNGDYGYYLGTLATK